MTDIKIYTHKELIDKVVDIAIHIDEFMFDFDPYRYDGDSDRVSRTNNTLEIANYIIKGDSKFIQFFFQGIIDDEELPEDERINAKHLLENLNKVLIEI